MLLGLMLKLRGNVKTLIQWQVDDSAVGKNSKNKSQIRFSDLSVFFNDVYNWFSFFFRKYRFYCYTCIAILETVIFINYYILKSPQLLESFFGLVLNVNKNGNWTPRTEKYCSSNWFFFFFGYDISTILNLFY
jgi:hypothetical protein